MQPTRILSIFASTLVFVTSANTAEQTRPAHWGYEGEHGPAKWGSLDPAYAACDKGKEQSPIDIAKAGAGTANPWTINYRPTSLKIVHHEHVVDIVDNGHTIQVRRGQHPDYEPKHLSTQTVPLPHAERASG